MRRTAVSVLLLFASCCFAQLAEKPLPSDIFPGPDHQEGEVLNFYFDETELRPSATSPRIIQPQHSLDIRPAGMPTSVLPEPSVGKRTVDNVSAHLRTSEDASNEAAGAGRRSLDQTPTFASSSGLQVSSMELLPAPHDRRSATNSVGTDSRDVQVSSEVPQMTVSTVGPDKLVVGRAAMYVIKLRNNSDFAASDIRVHASLPSWVQLRSHESSVGSVQSSRSGIVWNVDDISANQARELHVELVPRSGKPFDLNVDVAVQPQKAKTRITIEEPKVQVELHGHESVIYGESTPFRIEIRTEVIIKRGIEKMGLLV